MSEPVIEIRGLTKRFGDAVALADLNLDVQAGEVFGFLGPNGAGKTTTMRILVDQVRTTSGSAKVLGLDSRQHSVAIRARLGYLPGDLALYPRLTGAETLRFLGRLRGGVDTSYVEALAERLGADLSRKVAEYSTGNRQKIGLIQAFMHRPDLLILDEPAAGLDPLVQQEFHHLLAEVCAEGCTVFLSSHTLSEVERVADQVGIIRHGRLVVVERIDELKRKAIRRIDFEFAEPVPADLFAGAPGVRTAVVQGRIAKVTFEGAVNGLLQVATTHEVLNLHSGESDLEEIFLAYYRDAAPTSGHVTGEATDGR